MIQVRPYTKDDEPGFQAALDKDQTFHPGQKAEWFTGPTAHTEVYEDEHGPIAVLRCTKTLRLCTGWYDANDKSRNARAVVHGIRLAVDRARESGFTEIIFETQNPELAKFCTKVLGFQASAGEYVLTL